MHFPGRHSMNSCPPVYLLNNEIDFVDQFNYLGHRITCDLKDSVDIDQQKRLFCVRANIIASKFGKCSSDVKRVHFKTFCSNLYGCQLWCTYRKSNVSALGVCYNNAFRRLLGYAHDRSASARFVSNRVNTFHFLYRKPIYIFIYGTSKHIM